MGELKLSKSKGSSFFNRISSKTSHAKRSIKIKDHGALAGLLYSIRKNGSTSTSKTGENVDIFMNAVEEIVYDPNSRWFENENVPS